MAVLVEHESISPPFNYSSEKMSKVSDLGLEVAKIRTSSSEEAMYLLPGTGFHIKDQVRLLFDNILNSKPFESSINQIEQDIQGFKTEYLIEQPVFPIILDKAIYEGRPRLVGKLYGGKPLADSTSSIEREGVVRESIQQIEKYLLEAPSGSLVVMASPRGWSGYQDKDGTLEKVNKSDIKNGLAKEIKYPDSQTYCFQVQEDGSIRAFTLKTDMNIYQNEELLRRLGVDPDKLADIPDHENRVKRTVSNVAYIGPLESKSIEDVVDIIEDIKSDKTAYFDSKGESRDFSEMKALLQNPKALWTLDETTQKLIGAFKNYAKWRLQLPNENVGRDIEVALGLTVMKLMNEVRPPKLLYRRLDARVVQKIHFDVGAFFDPGQTLHEMQTLRGCAGGGGAAGEIKIVNSITPRISEASDSKVLCCTCPFCKKQVEATISNGKISCPECNASADWSETAGGE